MTLEELARGAIDRAAELHAENAALKEENERLKARVAEMGSLDNVLVGVVDDLGNWLCRDMEKDAAKSCQFTEQSEIYMVIADVAKRIRFYRENCLKYSLDNPAMTTNKPEVVAELTAPAVQGEPENWREKVADLIKAAHCEGQKSATGRDPSPFRWVNSESYKAAQALLAAPTPEAVQGEPEETIDAVISLVKDAAVAHLNSEFNSCLSKIRKLLTATPQPAEQQSISPTLASEAAKHLSNWLEMVMCECEGGHTCGYNEVKRTRDALMGVAVLKPSLAPTFHLGDRVRKTKGSQWKGRVVGTYSTTLTPEGYAVESDTEKGSVQIYPVGALELLVEDAEPDVSGLVEALEDLVSEIESTTCTHDNTHRGGAIWEICEDCGCRWADDRGGKPEFSWPESVEKARALIAAHRKGGCK